MIIEDIEIKDFRSHKQSKVSFDQGISVIVGDNGSGKTSILEAVNFALFKQKPNKDIAVDDLIRRGAEETVVSVRFHANGRVFRALRGRKIGRASGSALYQIKNSEETLIVKGEDEITREIEKILGVNGELFTSAIYIKQGEIDALISAAPAKRKEHIGKLLGADDLERAYQKMAELTKDYRFKIERFLSVPEDIKKTKAKIDEENKGLTQLKDKLEVIEKALLAKRREVEKNEKKIEALENLKDIETAKKENELQMKNILEKIKKIEDYERDLEKTEEVNRKYARLEKEIDALKEEKNKLAEYRERDSQLTKELESQLKKISEIERIVKDSFERYSLIFDTKIEAYDQLEQLHSEGIENLEKRIEGLKKEREEISSKIGKLKGNNEEIQKAVQELNEAKDRCPVCGALLTKEHKEELLKDYTSKIKKNLEEVSIAQLKLKGNEEEEIKLHSTLQKIRGVNLEVIKSRIEEKKERSDKIKELKTAIEENKKLMKSLKGLEKAISEKEAEKDALKEDNERYITAKRFLRENLPDKEKFLGHVNAIKKKLEEVNKELAALVEKTGYPPDIIAALDDLKRKRKLVLDELTALEKNKSGKKSVIEEKKRLIKALREELEELKEKEIESKKLVEFTIFLERIRQLFHKDNLQKDLRIKSKPLVERYTREVFDMFNLPYTDLTLTEDFTMVVYSPHGEESVDMLSGGERIASALALRIGIAKALSGSAMELIMLDEPTIHLDAQRRKELVEIIKRLSSIPQTIVVTHDKEFENAADRLILVEKIEGISQVKYEG